MAKCVCARQERDVVGDRAIELQRTGRECSWKVPKLSPTPEGEFPFVLGTGVDAQRQIPLRDETGAAERCAEPWLHLAVEPEDDCPMTDKCRP